MSAASVFYLIIGIIIFQFILDSILKILNATRFDQPLPEILADVYDREKYIESQKYKRVNFRFDLLTSVVSIVIVLLFFFLGGFNAVDTLAREWVGNHPVAVALAFFGIIIFALDIINTPFAIYRTFVIEEHFGFNKTTLALFVRDKLKSWLLTIILGGGILALVVGFYLWAGQWFWLYAWIAVAIFSVFMNMFYSRLLVPLFNKQTPLEEGELKEQIKNYTAHAGFKLKNIFVIDGSKRSTRANAYFSGFGSEKRITLYDTLIKELETNEIVAVLAHEVGHYKKKHVLFNMITSVALMGITLYLLSLFVNNPILSEALGVSTPGFHIGLIAFTILYSPISEITGLVMNVLSRKFEFQADDFAKRSYSARPLISSLKKLSKNNLSNLTPHPAYVFLHYSHPTLLQRIQKLMQ